MNGGNTATSTLSKYLSGSENAIFWTSAIASKWLRFIFQLPAISGLRLTGDEPLGRRASFRAFLLRMLSTSMPGSVLPSRYSSDAPPPVEM